MKKKKKKLRRNFCYLQDGLQEAFLTVENALTETEDFPSLGKAQYHRGKRSERSLTGHFHLLVLFFFAY